MDELDYEIALTLVPHLGPVKARRLMQEMSAEQVFKGEMSQFDDVEGVGPLMAMHIRSFKRFDEVRRIRQDCDNFQVSIVRMTDAAYPFRLKHIADAPLLLYTKGDIHPDAARSIGMVGTRRMTQYGRSVVEEFLKDLKSVGVVVHSGLAYGIDALAHRTCLDLGLPTVAYLAHGLDRIYPHKHRGLAQNILDQGGGLVSEYPPRSSRHKHQFPARNRLIAGAIDALIVVESAIKGGSLITADLAADYDREVFAVPSSVSAMYSQGCHELIRSNKARIMTGVDDLCQQMAWGQTKPTKAVDLSTEAHGLLDLMYQKEHWTVDELLHRSACSRSELAAILFELELKNCISSLPANRYRRK